ncbi:nucleoside-diphosphate-sugar epimerase [Friedmanniella endophytica]|uniref:Nucleoside-diphosphate-sugar epimerase n=1 Tax=Microlunatus kandeliicorticis TaxID=1759536 RepID=A0A7W3P6J1_9ACTN|nr:NAD-dependent epimerase/dehydratase family protein [Microlunatus kandeliicorticis]MBA8795029.1 nucleoside-diphosphate-sugar epimerase [Microlunatus kandeliicorticis]
MRVLVTGASGLLGGGVARALRDRGDRVTVLQRRPSGITGVSEVRGSVTDPAAVGSAVAGQDAVVHLAAKVDVVGAWDDFVATNVAGTSLVVGAARAAGVRRLVHVSSPSVAHAGRSLVGVGATPADPDHVRGGYARSKALAEQVALAADSAALAVTAVRPHLVWGPGDEQLIARIVLRARTGRLPVIGTGAALVDTTVLENAVDALVRALDVTAPDGVHGLALVVSNGEPRPIAELIAAICAAHGVPAPTRRVPVPPARLAGSLVERGWALRHRAGGSDDHGQPPLTRFLVEQLSTAHWFDQRETRRLLGWTPRVGLDEGFRRLAAAS